ncbi:hypothetical protein EYC84_005193 [Monilinia fructicola]|uniref:Uncharacterized protein n=1 Tax=Monilinia fructicola TaxID=38448 RepID=A0A5M9JY86_MONFR|nr:hypothetical protein EYC84_005193 [Monilinia fructicola]
MNTIKSFWVGWGSLCVAGGSAYYFAKQSINADRAARFEGRSKAQKAARSFRILQQDRWLRGEVSTTEPAPTRHAPESEGQRVREKSKYEPVEPFRSKKGDRFS